MREEVLRYYTLLRTMACMESIRNQLGYLEKMIGSPVKLLHYLEAGE